MKKSLCLLITLLFAATTIADELELTVEFCRHGARAPWGYPFNEPILHDFEVGLGNLTPGGMRMHTLIGQQLRQDLITESGSLPRFYDINRMTVYSDNYNRTIQSAESQMYGMYPLGTGLRMPNAVSIERSVPPMNVQGLNFKEMKLGYNALDAAFAPIPVRHWNITDELRNCPALEAMNPHHDEKLIKATGEKLAPYYEKISSWTGIAVERFQEEPVQAMTAVDVIACNYWGGYDVPNFDPDTDFTLLVELLEIGITFLSASTYEFAQLRAYPMISPLKTLVEGVIDGSNTQQFVLFSGHDSNLTPMLAALEQPNYYPFFASTIIFQVYKKDTTESSTSDASNYYVKAFFNNEELKFKTCSSEPCSAEDFVDFLGTTMLPNWNELCNAQIFLDIYIYI